MHVDVNEGPAILRRNGRVFVVYSAGGCWTDSYALGMLAADQSADLLNVASWQKSAIPVFWQAPKAGAFGPGTTASSNRPMARRIGSSTTPILNRGRAAAIAGRQRAALRLEAGRHA